MKPLSHDNDLLCKSAAGDEQAFGVLYNRYHPMVYARAHHYLKSATQAEEVLQEVMLKLWLNAGKLSNETNLAAYLTTLTRNRSFQMLRRKVLEARADLELGKNWTESNNQTEEQILLADSKRLLQESIAMLPPQQKMVYELCHVHELRYEQAAEQMNLSIETVRSYMKLALRSIRSYIKSHSNIPVILIILKIF